jgi:hypothetical protein
MILFGKDIFFQAEIMKLHKDIELFKREISLYKYKYRYFPGDDKFATSNFKNFEHIKNGDGSNYIGDNTVVSEEQQIIRHLRAGGFMKGDPDEYPLHYPSNPYNGVYKFTYKVFKKGDTQYKSNVIVVTRVPKDVAAKYDEKFDNGDLNSGYITFEIDKDSKKKNIGNLIIKLDIY